MSSKPEQNILNILKLIFKLTGAEMLEVTFCMLQNISAVEQHGINTFRLRE